MSLKPSLTQVLFMKTTGMSLHERFTFLRSNPHAIGGGMGQTIAVDNQNTARSRHLAQQMERRPAVIAALKLKRRSLQQRLGANQYSGGASSSQFRGRGVGRRGSIMDRLTLSRRGMGRSLLQQGTELRTRGGRNLGRSQSVTSLFRSQSLQSLNGAGRTRGTSYFRGNRETQFRSQRGFRQNNRGAGRMSAVQVGRSPSRITRDSRGAARGRLQTLRGRVQITRGRGGGLQYARGRYQNVRGGFQNTRGGFQNTRGRMQNSRGRMQRGRGIFRGRGRRGRFGPPPSKEELDNELDQYMASTRSNLDRELDSYRNQADTEMWD